MSKIEEKIKELEKQIEELKREKEEVSKYPKIGDICYLLFSDGEISEEYEWEDTANDYTYWNYGSIFFTKEDAEFEREKRKVIREMEEFSRPFNKGEHNYYIYYNHNSNCINVDFEVFLQRGDIYFESTKKIDEMIEKVGRDRVKKYYLGVDD